MHRLAAFAALALFTPLAAHAQPAAPVETYDQEMARITAGMPKDVADFILRRPGCLHWGGEYGGPETDPARAKQINDAMAELGCDKLETDEAALKAKYKNNPAVIKRLAEVHRDYGGE